LRSARGADRRPKCARRQRRRTKLRIQQRRTPGRNESQTRLHVHSLMCSSEEAEALQAIRQNRAEKRATCACVRAAGSSKFQALEQLQTSNRKISLIQPSPGSPTALLRKCGSSFGYLFGACGFSGGWRLEFFTHPQMHRGRMRFRKKETPPGIRREGHGLVFVLPLSSVVLRFCSLKPAQRLCHAQGVMVMTR
jgi:hypothetical protein